PEYVSLKENWTVERVLNHIRTQAALSETVYYLFVTNVARQLTGILSLRQLVVGQAEQSIGEIMTREVVSAQTSDDQEEVARMIQRYDFLAVPVVDAEDRLVGIITVDDVLDILEEEATEDIYSLGGVQSGGENYFQSNLLDVAKKRVVWLSVPLCTNTVTAGIIVAAQEDILKVAALTAFIPLLIGSGGNVGAQSSTVVIRGLNTDELRIRDAFKVIIREATAGAFLGLMLSLAVTLWAYFVLANTLPVSITVGLSLFGISVLASSAGAGLPFLFQSFGLDPALMSAPFITTIVDVLGVLIYINLARYIINL
ncbi:MAG: magnesium transporter, partial [Cyanobacteria bacterium J06576_12]